MLSPWAVDLKLCTIYIITELSTSLSKFLTNRGGFVHSRVTQLNKKDASHFGCDCIFTVDKSAGVCNLHCYMSIDVHFTIIPFRESGFFRNLTFSLNLLSIGNENQELERNILFSRIIMAE